MYSVTMTLTDNKLDGAVILISGGSSKQRNC